ncbi:MAG: hypothetical protein AAGK93_10320, partial [Pseudomonadota bacterium]
EREEVAGQGHHFEIAAQALTHPFDLTANLLIDGRATLLFALASRDFLALEESDALNALENTHASNKNASARLATYLLLDAAVT